MATSVVVLNCYDGAKFVAPVSLAQRSGLVAAAAAAPGTGEFVLNLPMNVSSKGVDTIIEYWEGRAAAAASGGDLRGFDGEFVRGLSHDALIDLIHAAHHLADEGLFNLFVAN